MYRLWSGKSEQLHICTRVCPAITMSVPSHEIPAIAVMPFREWYQNCVFWSLSLRIRKKITRHLMDQRLGLIYANLCEAS